jgi:hypothetical protein
MQGVRRKIGCTSCKRRKKGCDYQKPMCGRCRRLSVACQYPDRKYLFLDPRDGSQKSPSSSKSPGPTVLTTQSRSTLHSTEVDLQVVAAFWEIFLPQENPVIDGSIGGILAAPWIPAIKLLADGDNFLRTALWACAFAGLGWWQEDQSLLRRGLQLYSQALLMVNNALGDPVMAQSDLTLACCRVLSLYELFRRVPTAGPVPTREKERGSQAADWRNHVQGTCRLLQLRGRQTCRCSWFAIVRWSATRGSYARPIKAAS